MTRIYVYSIDGGASRAITSDRYDSSSPTWSPDGKWIYFLSDRNFASLVGGPWGSRQPEPFFDHQTKIYHVALRRDECSPFKPADELYIPPKEGEKKEPGNAPPVVAIDLEGIETRLLEVPVPPGNYSDLGSDGKRLYFISSDTTLERKQTLKTMAIDSKRGTAPETFLEDVSGYELSLDNKKLLVRKGNDLYVVDAGAKAPPELAKSQVLLKDWSFDLDPRDEWRQMFIEAWRLERDYFYDRNMHGLDWPAVRDRYLPLVDRVTDRAELSDILAQMVGELSALHIFVRGGDMRRGQDQVQPGSLGATFLLDESAGGYRVVHIYQSDPDSPEGLSPLLRPEVDIQEGDIIESINGVRALSAPDLGALLRDQANKQVLLRVKPKGGSAERSVVVAPITLARESSLRLRRRHKTKSAMFTSARWAARTWRSGNANSTPYSIEMDSSSTCATTTAET